MDKRGRGEGADRKRRAANPLDAGSGEGAASALATLRAIEQNRNACAPTEEVRPAPADGAAQGPSRGLPERTTKLA